MKTGNGKRAVGTVVLMMVATVLSKLLGLIRVSLLADMYGTGMEATAFAAASRIPLSFFDILFSAAIVGCFIPIYGSFGKDRDREASEFACVFLNFVILFSGILAIVGMIVAPVLISLIAPGLDADTARLAVKLLRIMFPMIIFAGSAYTLVGVLQTKQRYLLPAFISSVSNGGVILYFLFFNNLLGEYAVYGLAAAYLTAWILQFLTLALPLTASGQKWRPLFDLRTPALRRALKMTPPIMIGSWLMPTAALLGTFFASLTNNAGDVTVFDYSNNIYIIVAGILSYSICNYIFPLISGLSEKTDDYGEYCRIVRQGLTAAVTLCLPFAAALAILAREGTAILYLRGEFSPEAASRTASSLMWLSAAVPAFAVTEVMNRAFFARKDTVPPMAAALCGIAANAATATVLVCLCGYGSNAVAVANAVGQVVSALTLIIMALIRISGVLDRRFAIKIVISISGAVLSYATMTAIYRLLSNDPWKAGFIGNAAVCVGVFLPGAIVYLLILYLTRNVVGTGKIKADHNIDTKKSAS